jgi:hypothetical protein
MGGELQEHPTRPPPPAPGGPRVFESWAGNDVSDDTAVHDDTSILPCHLAVACFRVCGRPSNLTHVFFFPPSTAQQKFYCDGRCITGPTPQNLIGTALVVFVPSVVFNVFVARGASVARVTPLTFIPRQRSIFYFFLLRSHLPHHELLPL